MRWVDLLEEQTNRFAAVLASGDLASPIRTCPGWSLADLGEHLRSVHRWAAHAVTEGSPDGDTPAVPAEEIVGAYRSAAANLVLVLRSTPEDAPAWTFGPEQVSGFWRRRQVHETTIHLYDALDSQGRATEWMVSPDLAWDAIEEVRSVLYPRQVRLRRTEPLPAAINLVATDLDRSVILGEGQPEAELHAPAADLLLLVWKRLPVADPRTADLLARAVTP